MSSCEFEQILKNIDSDIVRLINVNIEPYIKALFLTLSTSHSESTTMASHLQVALLLLLVLGVIIFLQGIRNPAGLKVLKFNSVSGGDGYVGLVQD